MEAVNPFDKTESYINSLRILLFSPGEAMEAFCADYLSKEKIAAWVLARLHPHGPYCPACKIKITDKTTLNNFNGLRRCKCKNCKAWFNALKGTALHHTELDIADIFLLAVLLKMKVDIKIIAKVLKCHSATIKNWQTKFKVVENEI